MLATKTAQMQGRPEKLQEKPQKPQEKQTYKQ